MSNATPTTGIQSALDAALARIRVLYPDVPASLAVVLSSGKGKIHGHFEPGAWVDAEGDSTGSARHEIMMSTESLARGAEATLTTLIHECAHALCHATGVRDTSRGGRYHNKRFRAQAEVMGLVTDKHPTIGFTTTGLMESARDLFAGELSLLGEALVTYRKPVQKVKKPSTTVRVSCDCDVPVSVPIKWWERHGQTTMKCADCGSLYEEV